MRGRNVVAQLIACLLLGSNAQAASVAMKTEQALQQSFPQVKVDRIAPTDIPGLYEVVTGQNVIYYYQEKDLIFVGEIYDKGLKSLTAERKRDLLAAKMKDLPLDKAVKIGTGKSTVVEFTDPDCPYCRKASEFFKGRTDVIRYVFFAPLAHPDAITKIQYILQAKDKSKAYEEMMGGSPLPQPTPVFTDEVKALAQEHLALTKGAGITGTPSFFINGKVVVGADLKQIEQLLGDPPKEVPKAP